MLLSHVLPTDSSAAIVLFIYIVRIFFHYVSDAQNFFTLRERKGLIEDGLFTNTRNPNISARF